MIKRPSKLNQPERHPPGVGAIAFTPVSNLVAKELVLDWGGFPQADRNYDFLWHHWADGVEHRGKTCRRPGMNLRIPVLSGPAGLPGLGTVTSEEPHYYQRLRGTGYVREGEEGEERTK